MTTTPTTIAATVKTGAHMKGWHLSAGDEHVVFDARNEQIVNVQCGGMTGRKYGEASDIASLIAAAPALLEALQLVADTYGFDPSVDSSIWQDVFAALSAATGEA